MMALTKFSNTFREKKWWAWQGLNLRPLRCQHSALPLSYTPTARGQAAHLESAASSRKHLIGQGAAALNSSAWRLSALVGARCTRPLIAPWEQVQSNRPSIAEMGFTG